MTRQRPGGWISLEGIDGCGKTTVARGLRDYLFLKGYNPLYAPDPPTDTIVGAHVRELVTKFKLDNLTQAMIITAARSDNYHKYVKPALDEGRIVISDRNIHTSLVYQPDCAKEIFLLHDLGIGRYPDKVFVLDVPAQIAYDRLSDTDACEDVDMDEWKRRRQGFIDLGAFADVTVIKCGDKSKGEVLKKLKKHINSFLDEGRSVSYLNRKYFTQGGIQDETSKEL